MLLGVGYRGNIVKDECDLELYKKLLSVWSSMIKRCYYGKAVNYKKYGGNGVTVSDRWKCFKNFYNDVQHIPNYDRNALLAGELQLDKDLLSKDTKVYSKETCCWLNKDLNSYLGYAKQIKPIRAINTTLGIDIITYQHEVAKLYDLTLTNINRCLHNKQKHIRVGHFLMCELNY